MSGEGILGIAVCALCAAALGTMLRGRSRELSLLLSIGAAVVILYAALSAAGPLVSQILSFTEEGGLGGLCLTVMLKAVGLTIIGQLAARLCRDGGEAALAYGVELAAKLAVLAAAMPVLEKLFQYVGEIISL